MKKIILMGMLILALFIVGCSQKVVCNKPYILVGSNCCLDQNNNSICDKDEGINEEDKTIEPTQTVVTSKNSKLLDEASIKEAIESGIKNKFDIETYDIEFLSYESLTLYTPYKSLELLSASKAKEYDQLTQKEIDEIVKADEFNIVTVVKSSISSRPLSSEIENIKAVIKVDDKIIKPKEPILPTYGSTVECLSITRCYWWGIVSFRFPNFSEIKDKQIKFILILKNEEREYDIDMSKYK